MKKNKGVLLAAMLPALAATPDVMAMDNVSISGVIEAEYGSSTGYGDPVTGASGPKESGYALATVELGVDAKLNDNVDGHILILHEDDAPDTWEVDEGTITLHGKDNIVFLTAGRMYVPFGNFESNMVSDPLTLELGETREAAVQIGTEYMGFSLSAFLFNGDTFEDSNNALGGETDDTADQNGFAIGYSYEKDKFRIGAGYSSINNIADTDAISDYFINGTIGAGELVGYTGGNAYYLTAGYGPVSVIFEKVAAKDAFDVIEMDFNGVGAQPEASNAEIAGTFPVSGIEVTIGVSQQKTVEALALGLPEKTSMVTVSAGIYKNTTLSIESRTDTDYDTTDSAAGTNGTGEKAKTTTIQLAVEF